MTNGSSQRTSRFTYHAPRLTLLAAFIFTATYLLVAVSRIVYPYDIDFLENSMLMQSLRMGRGQPVYLPPNVEFAPHVYTPLYMWLGGMLFKIAGPGYVPLRLLSFGATVISAFVIYRAARTESGRRWLGIACAGLYFGGYRIVDGWYELARVDSLFVMLALVAFGFGVYTRGMRRLILPALAMALVFYAKQTGVFFAVALFLVLLVSVGRRAWLYVAIYAGLVVAFVVTMNVATEGWFGYYIFGIASLNPVEPGRVVTYVRFEILGLMAGLSLMALAAALLGARRSGRRAFFERPWLIGITAAIAVSGLGRASVGGATNNLMPAYAFLCLAPALLFAEWNARLPAIMQRWKTSESLHPPPLAFRLASNPAACIAALILVQFALGAYNPFRFIPSAEMRASGDRLIERIASFDGEVFVMMHPYYALLAGKQPSAQVATLWHARERGTLPLPADLVNRIQARYYAAILSDETLFETDPPLLELIEANYVRAETLDATGAPPTTTGMFSRTRAVYAPRK